MRMKLHKKLDSDTMEMVDVSNWGKKIEAPKVTIDVSIWSDKRRECKQQTLLECKRTFLGH